MWQSARPSDGSVGRRTSICQSSRTERTQPAGSARRIAKVGNLFAPVRVQSAPNARYVYGGSMPDGGAAVHPDDVTLLDALRGGSGDAAALVMQRHNRTLWRIARG